MGQRSEGIGSCPSPRIDMALRHRGRCCEARFVSAVRKKPRFTHVGANLRGDVSGKRFSTHVGERNVARIGEGRCGNDKVMASAAGE